MRKKQKNQGLACILAAVMAASVLAGCGGNGGTASTAAAGTTAPVAATAAAGTTGAGDPTETEAAKGAAAYPATFVSSGTDAETYTKNVETFQQEFLDYFEQTGQMDKVKGYEEPVEVNMTRMYTSGLQAIIDSLQQKYGESYEENRFTDIIKRLLNVDISFNWVTGQSQYEQKLRLDMAANELPDIFFVTAMNDLAELAEEGLIWEMDDLIEQYGSDDLKKVKESQEYAYQKAMIDGKLYGIPATMSATDNVRYLYIREDWLKNLGLEYPKTLDELAKVIEAFATQDPDGNGVDDTYGMSGVSDYSYCFGAIFQGFGAHPKQIYEVEKGKNVYGGTTEEAKKALAYLTDLYQKGYIQADFSTQNATQWREVIAQGKVGIVMGNHAMSTYITDALHELDPSVNWVVDVAPTENGEMNKILLAPTVNGFVVVNKNFEHPEIAVKMADIVISAIFNNSAGGWWYYENNASYSLSPINVFMTSMTNLETYLELMDAFEKNDPTGLSAKGQAYWEIMNGEEGLSKWSYDSMFGEDSTMATLNKYYESGNYYWVTFNGQYNDLMNKNFSSIGSTMNQIFLSIITGQQDLESGWSQWIDTYNKLKGDEIMAYVNEWCKENDSYN